MSKKKKIPKRNPNAVEVEQKEGQDGEKLKAQTVLRPSVQSAAIIQAYSGDALNINPLISTLEEQIECVYGGDLKCVESMLIAQAHTLDTLFGHFARQAQGTAHLNNLKIYMNLGLKAQSQCRMTLEALAEIKNPKPYIQNNKAQYQQVNNGTAEPRAGEKSKTANELLEDKTHEQEWLDTGAPETTIRNDKELETVGAEHGG